MRKWIVTGVVIACLGVFGGVGYWATRAPEPEPEAGPTSENFRRLRLGMTRQEAEGIIGSQGVQQPSSSCDLGHSFVHEGAGCRIRLWYHQRHLAAGRMEYDDGTRDHIAAPPRSFFGWLLSLIGL